VLIFVSLTLSQTPAYPARPHTRLEQRAVCLFTSPAFACFHCAYPRRDGQAELTMRYVNAGINRCEGATCACWWPRLPMCVWRQLDSCRKRVTEWDQMSYSTTDHLRYTFPFHAPARYS